MCGSWLWIIGGSWWGSWLMIRFVAWKIVKYMVEYIDVRTVSYPFLAILVECKMASSIPTTKAATTFLVCPKMAALLIISSVELSKILGNNHFFCIWLILLLLFGFYFFGLFPFQSPRRTGDPSGHFPAQPFLQRQLHWQLGTWTWAPQRFPKSDHFSGRHKP